MNSTLPRREQKSQTLGGKSKKTIQWLLSISVFLIPQKYVEDVNFKLLLIIDMEQIMLAGSFYFQLNANFQSHIVAFGTAIFTSKLHTNKDRPYCTSYTSSLTVFVCLAHPLSVHLSLTSVTQVKACRVYIPVAQAFLPPSASTNSQLCLLLSSQAVLTWVYTAWNQPSQTTPHLAPQHAHTAVNYCCDGLKLKIKNLDFLVRIGQFC